MCVCVCVFELKIWKTRGAVSMQRDLGCTLDKERKWILCCFRVNISTHCFLPFSVPPRLYSVVSPSHHRAARDDGGDRGESSLNGNMGTISSIDVDVEKAARDVGMRKIFSSAIFPAATLLRVDHAHACG